MWRDVFAYASHPEIYLDAQNVRGLLPEGSETSIDVVEAVARLRERCANSARAWSEVLPTRDEPAHSTVVSLLISQSSPYASALGVPLQGLSAPSVFEDPIHLRFMALLADDIGVGAAERWRFDRFRDIARAHGVMGVSGNFRELVDRRDIRDGMFRLPAIAYALSRRSDVFDYELIGFDLAGRVVGLLPVWQALTDYGTSGDTKEDSLWRELDLSRGRGAAIDEGTDLSALSLELAEQVTKDHDRRRRIVAGIRIFEALLLDFDELLRAVAASNFDPRLAMAILVQDRAREARVYHSGFKLAGCSLSEWFTVAQTDPMPLIDAIAASKLVRAGNPDKSPLVNGLLAENGAMFRIFTKEDVATIRRWIAALGEGEVSHAQVLPAAIRLRQDYRHVRGGDLNQGIRPWDVRSAYYLLQGRALAPNTREFARDYCRFWLGRSRGSLDRTGRSLPQTWRPGQLREWLLTSHDAHAEEYDTLRQADVPSREAIINQTLQIAPLTLIDGAWLQGFTEVSLGSSRTGAPLFATYWDELGNGEWRINHPKIYRDVLASMDIVLPPTGSLAFSQDQRFTDVSFRLPVYWLCLGKQPLSLRPEILGMNLAMELSGVGGTYRNARRFLKHYGFPTTFVDVHNTIDNVSTGHSAWAADAIDAYMQETRDVVPAEETWNRIRIGYESLSPIVDDERSLEFFTRRTGKAQSLNDVASLLHRPLTYDVAAE